MTTPITKSVLHEIQKVQSSFKWGDQQNDEAGM